MTALPRSALMAVLVVCCAVVVCAQQPAPTAPISVAANHSSALSGGMDMDAMYAPGGAVRLPVNTQPVEGSWFLRRFGIGTYSSPLGFGGRIAVSLTHRLNLRAGGDYFSYGITQSMSGIPVSAGLKLQEEQASLDWYPFHNSFHLSPGILFGSSNRAFGSAAIAPGSSFTVNGVTYYSASADPIHASGSILFARTAPTFTLGWGDWVRGERQRHLAFPVELGFAYMGDPTTALSFTGVACADAAQQNCQNVASDSSIQSNIQAEQTKLQKDADYLRFFPILAGGVVYRF